VTAKDSANGSCQCGNIRYQVIGQPITVYICHCTDCQKQASSAFGISVWFRRSDFILHSGTLSFWSTLSDKGNTKLCAFCENCGSRIYHADSTDSEILSLKGGTLDKSASIQPVAHIWCQSAQAWVQEILLSNHQQLCFQTEPDCFDQIVELYNQSQRW
jgi:hypothetical protein